MIKARGTSTSGRPFMLLGLSNVNITRLMDGQPIHVDGREIGIDFDVSIYYGLTEQSMAGELAAAGLIPPRGEA